MVLVAVADSAPNSLVNSLAFAAIDIPGDMTRRFLDSRGIKPEQLVSSLPIGDMGRPEELVAAVRYPTAEWAPLLASGSRTRAEWARMSRTAWRRATCLTGLAALVTAGLALAAAPAGAVTVSTEAELQTAFANAGETSIVLANSIDLTCAGGGDLDRTSATSLTIEGNGFTIRQTCAGERVMQQQGSGSITLNAVTITGGTNSSGNGGGILSSASVTLTNSVVTGNSTAVNGGGIATNPGTLTISSSDVEATPPATTGAAQTSRAER